MRLFHRLAATVWLLGATLGGPCAPAQAVAQVTTPGPGSSLRARILDAFRPRIQAEIGGRIEFVVNVIHVMNEWAFVQVRPRRPGGAPIDWRATRFRQDFEQDLMSDLVLGLLRRSGGRWTVVNGAMGPTDVAWENWVRQYQLPRALFLPP
jgi:hypothetical protein